MGVKKAKACFVSDYVAEQVLKMAKKFYSDPKNVKKYREWHLKEYGYLPEEHDT